MSIIDIDIHSRATVEHHAVVALAYDVHGLDFANLYLDCAFGGEVTLKQPRTMDAKVAARVALVAEVKWLARRQARDGHDIALSETLEEWADEAADDEPGIIHQVGADISGALPWAQAFHDANAELIGEVADVIAATPVNEDGSQSLPYTEFRARFAGRVVEPTYAAVGAYAAAQAPFMPLMTAVWVANQRRVHRNRVGA